MFNNNAWMSAPWVKMVAGAGTAGVVALLASRVIPRTPTPAHTFTHLTTPQNDALAQDHVLNVALGRLTDYASADSATFNTMVDDVALLLLIELAPPTSALRRAEHHVRAVKRGVALLRKATLARSNNNSSVTEEFDELSQIVLGVCDDRLFNLHQSYTPTK